MKRILILIVLMVSITFAKCEYYSDFYSSFINSALYCPTSDYTGVITLDLNGRFYDYNISYDTWVGFKQASSKGRYYNRYIK